MSQQHQYGLLPCSMQGGVIHETAAKRPYLVRINRVFNAVNIHLPYPISLMRFRIKDGDREVAAVLAYESNGK